MSLTWAQALAWRLRRQLLDPVGAGSVADVVERLGAVAAWPEPSADLAIGARREGSRAGDVVRAVDAGEVVKAYSFRGAVHLMSVASAGDYLALRASGRQWELPSWIETYGLAPADWPAFRAAVRDAVAEVPLTRDELAAAVARKRRYQLAAAGLTSQSDTLLKALMWQGDVCFGPARDGNATVRRLDTVPGWTGLPDVDEAGRRAVAAHLRTYGPATPDQLHYRLGEGLSAGSKAIRRWVDDLDDRLVSVDVEGETTLVLQEDVDELTAASPSSVVRLLPGQDQWVMGPGTADPHVVPPAQRPVVSRRAHLVVVGGLVSGTWAVKGDRMDVDWFPEATPAGRGDLAPEVDRLATMLGRTLELAEHR